MLFWFLDRALLIYVILALFAIGLALVYRNHRDRRSAIALALTVGLGVLLFVLSLFVVTDRQQIVKNLHAMRDAALANKPADLVKHLAPDFKFQGYDRDDLAKALPLARQFAKMTDIALTRIHFEKTSRTEGAKVSFTATAHVAEGPLGRVECEGDFVFLNNAWLLRAIDVRDHNGQPVHIGTVKGIL